MLPIHRAFFYKWKLNLLQDTVMFFWTASREGWKACNRGIAKLLSQGVENSEMLPTVS
jgi:hypothetical protein